MLRALLAAVLACLACTSYGQSCAIATRSEKIGDGEIVYDRVGAGPAVLLVHGLFAQKEQWSDLACRLAAAGYDVIAADMPGYGKSTGFPLGDYRLERQVAALDELATRLGVARFHLAGNSLGGAVVFLYASRHPERVRSLAFLGSPLGIEGWGEGIREPIYRGINPFIPQSEAELDLELALLFVKPPSIPDDVRKTLVAQYREQEPHYVRVWNIVNLYDDVLRDTLPPRTPTLIVWGNDDRVYPPAGAAKLARRIPGSVVRRLPHAGHLLHMESAAEAAPLYVRFLREPNASRTSAGRDTRSLHR